MSMDDMRSTGRTGEWKQTDNEAQGLNTPGAEKNKDQVKLIIKKFGKHARTGSGAKT